MCFDYPQTVATVMDILPTWLFTHHLLLEYRHGRELTLVNYDLRMLVEL